MIFWSRIIAISWIHGTAKLKKMYNHIYMYKFVVLKEKRRMAILFFPNIISKDDSSRKWMYPFSLEMAVWIHDV